MLAQVKNYEANYEANNGMISSQKDRWRMCSMVTYYNLKNRMCQKSIWQKKGLINEQKAQGTYKIKGKVRKVGLAIVEEVWVNKAPGGDQERDP